MRREARADDDGFRSSLVPGLRSSQDALQLADEIAFASGRLRALRGDPPDLYVQARAEPDAEQAAWTCFLIAYLSPIEGDDPFAGARAALCDWRDAELPDLDGVPLGPRTSHDPARGLSTLVAYRQWAERAGSQMAALTGDPAWGPERRFERIFERLALPGFGRVGRFDLLVTLGRLGLAEMQADSLHFADDDDATVAAKRIFGIGDRHNLERRARTLAESAGIELDSLDLALANWAATERATMGFEADVADAAAGARTLAALGL